MLNDNADNYIPKGSHLHITGSGILSSGNNTSMQRYDRPSIGSTGFVAGLVIFYGVVAATAVSSNIFIVITVTRRLVPRNTVNIFLSSLAMSDLVMVVLSLFDCFAFLNGGWIFGEWTCKVQSLFIEVSFTASTLTLVAVSCERYLLICHPHMKRRTITAIYYIVISVWFSALCICSPLLHGYIVYRDIDLKEMTEKLVCANHGWSRKYQMVFYSVYSAIIYLIPLMVMAFAHWRISRSVKDRRPKTVLPVSNGNGNCDKKPSVCYTIREESSGGSSDVAAESHEFKRKASSSVQKSLLGSLGTLRRKISQAERDMNRRDRMIKAIRLLFVVTVTFFLLWTPFVIMRIIQLAKIPVNEYVYKFSEVLILSSTAVNGFIYAFMSPPFRKAFKAILCCQGRREILSRDSGPSLSNSEDNNSRKAHRLSRGSTSGFSYGVDSRTGTLNGTRNHSIGSKTSV